MSRPVPPPQEQALGLRSYLTATAGIGGRLRTEPEDFRVIETGEGPPPGEGPYAAARIRLRNWETNRFAAVAAKTLGIGREQVAFAGMKDKRAVTEQWFTFRCEPARLEELSRLQDVVVLESRPARKSHFAGAHEGNRFVIRVRGAEARPQDVEATAAAIRAEGGVPNFFGPQRFGGAFRPITHRVGAAMVRGDLAEAVRLYVGNPMEGEGAEAQAARAAYEAGDVPKALELMPRQLDPERAMLARLAKRPGDFRHALEALPGNLLQLFVHACQSWVFNDVVSQRVEQGLGLSTAHLGDRVMGSDHDGTQTALVGARNREHIQENIRKGRLVVTAPLVGMEAPLAEGRPGEVERRAIEGNGLAPRDFRVRELPEAWSPGRRRAVMQEVRDLQVTWVEGDPVFSFALGKGSYATVVLREFMKAPIADY